MELITAAMALMIALIGFSVYSTYTAHKEKEVFRTEIKQFISSSRMLINIHTK